ncbi:MAG: hypothetical protein SFW09_13960 [Hyphomicrobiaceae bacterium]|nr:hypothetical protein [Hyphomicrobiaceae bacterium]
MATIRRAAVLAVAAVFYGLVGLGLASGLTGSVPDDKSLSTISGRLGGVRLVTHRGDGLPAFEFSVTPDLGRPVSLHARSFGDRGAARRLVAASGQTVTVRYLDRLLGNPAYAVERSDGGDVLSLAATRAFLAQEDAETAIGYQNGLVIYGFGPLLLGMVFLLQRWSRPGGRATSASVQRAIDAHALRFRRYFILAALLLVVVVLLRDGFKHPHMIDALVGVLGPKPFGLEPQAAFVAVVMLAIMPLAASMWYLTGALHHAQRRDGVPRIGKLSIVRGLYENWDDAEVRREARRGLIALGVLVVLAAIWIVAAERAGH